jgi:hypothetical protein
MFFISKMNNYRLARELRNAIEASDTASVKKLLSEASFIESSNARYYNYRDFKNIIGKIVNPAIIYEFILAGFPPVLMMTAFADCKNVEGHNSVFAIMVGLSRKALEHLEKLPDIDKTSLKTSVITYNISRLPVLIGNLDYDLFEALAYYKKAQSANFGYGNQTLSEHVKNDSIVLDIIAIKEALARVPEVTNLSALSTYHKEVKEYVGSESKLDNMLFTIWLLALVTNKCFQAMSIMLMCERMDAILTNISGDIEKTYNFLSIHDDIRLSNIRDKDFMFFVEVILKQSISQYPSSHLEHTGNEASPIIEGSYIFGLGIVAYVIYSIVNQKMAIDKLRRDRDESLNFDYKAANQLLIGKITDRFNSAYQEKRPGLTFWKQAFEAKAAALAAEQKAAEMDIVRASASTSTLKHNK